MKTSSLILLAVLCGLLAFAGVLPAQEATAPAPAALDTLRLFSGDSVAIDTLATDSLAVDTTLAARDESGVDTVVNYSANTIDFEVERRVSVLSGDAVISYKDMRLEAAEIEVDWDRQILTARGVADTLYTDSTQTEIDTVIVIGRPHFQQGPDDFLGDEIAYNMKTKVGRVRGGSTEYEEGFYYGEQFKRVSDDVILVHGGHFTTCEADTPHYHFAAQELKVVVGRRVIARPVVLCFEDVPVMAVPFGIFPQQHGRSSGILVPNFGDGASQGRFLRDIGYYWATSDYMDLIGSIDYYEKLGILGRAGLNYNVLYKLNGAARFEFNTQRVTGEGSSPTVHRGDYSLSWNHAHTIDQYTRIIASGAYYSSKSFVSNVGSEQELLNQSVQSNATLSKSWPNSPWTMSANVNYTQNLNTDTWSSTLPGITLNHKSGQVFPPPKAPRNIRGAVAVRESDPPWYRALQWSYGMTYRNDMAMNKQLRETGIRLGLMDINGRQGSPTVLRDDDTTHVYQKDGLVHSGRLSANARVLKYVNLMPSMSLSSLWTRRVVRYRPDGKILQRDDDEGFFQRTTFNLGTSATTKLYGSMIRPLGLGASFRHTLTPSAGFTYTPDFSDDFWNYYERVSLPDGRSYQYDRFPATEMVSGGTPRNRSEFINFSLDQLFQMKTGEAAAEGEEVDEKAVKRFDLLSWTMGTGVDLRRDSLRWNDLSMSFRTSIPGKLLGPVQNLSLDVNTVHSLYEQQNRYRVRRFFWEREGASWYAPLDLTRADVNVGFAVRAERVGALFGLSERRERVEGEARVEDDAAYAMMDSLAVPADSITMPYNPYENMDPERGRPAVATNETRGPSQLYQMPLSLQVSVRQSRDYVNRSVTSSMATNATFSLTPRWDVSMSYVFDLHRREVRDTRVSVTRDLHCWEASFQWSPLGIRPGYFLRIGLKAPQLRDVKIERHRGRGFGGAYY